MIQSRLDKFYAFSMSSTDFYIQPAPHKRYSPTRVRFPQNSLEEWFVLPRAEEWHIQMRKLLGNFQELFNAVGRLLDERGIVLST